MKKILMTIAAILCLICSVFSFAACGEGKPDNGGSTGNGGAQTEQPDGEGQTPKPDEKAEYTVSFDTQGGDKIEQRKVKEGESINLPEATKKGYDFEGWKINGDQLYKANTQYTVTSNVSFVASWKAITYTITYNNVEDAINNNKTSYNVNDSEIVLEDLTRKGYDFLGWFTSERDGEQVRKIDTQRAENIQLWARWQIKSYTITYNNVEDAINNNKTSYNINDNEIVLEDLTRKGYDFLGWFTEETQGEQVRKIDPKRAENIQLWARWQLKSYTITYNNVEDATNNNKTSYNVNDSEIVLEDLTRKGYDFLGWFTEETNGEQVRKIDTQGAENIQLWARWQLKSYTITYNNVEDATNNNKTSYNVNDSEIVLEDLTRKGYDFLGWFTSERDGEQVRKIDPKRAENIQLWARWSKDTEGLEFTQNDDGQTYSLSGFGSVTEKDIVIPQYYYDKATSKNYPVTGINPDVFNGKTVTSIVVPDSITEIAPRAFFGCNGLTSITLPFVGKNRTANGYEGVFGYIFGYVLRSNSSDEVSGAVYQYRVSNKYYYYYIPESLKTVTINGGKINNSAFYNCANLITVNLGNGVTSIDNNYAFNNCKNLTEVKLGESVNYIYNNAFNNCDSLKAFTVAANNNKYKSFDGIIYDYDITTSIVIPKDLSGVVNIPENINRIGSGAFRERKNLTGVVFGGNVTIIESYAFTAAQI